MDWGQTWEWTADPFRPHPGFQAHPYRDYSAPWFDSHQLVKGCSIFTEPLLKSERYRNFFQAHRTDAAIGFRSVSPGQAAAS
jgi:EgtB-related family protein